MIFLKTIPYLKRKTLAFLQKLFAVEQWDGLKVAHKIREHVLPVFIFFSKFFYTGPDRWTMFPFY